MRLALFTSATPPATTTVTPADATAVQTTEVTKTHDDPNRSKGTSDTSGASRRGWRFDGVTWMLWGLIVLATVLRFARLTHPTLWIDEGATFSRITGTFQDMLDILKNDGFGPLHYEAYWLLAQVVYPTPWMMRLIPATTGVLMVPAMYALAKQLLGRRPALVVAALTTCSSYMLFYSRDAKMYPHFWLMVTLHIASLLWWQRSGKRLAWLCWVAAGLAAVGLHATGIMLVAIEPLFLLATLRGPRKSLRLLSMAIGLGIILGAVGTHYLVFNHWTQRSGGIVPWTAKDATGKPIKWSRSGLSWIPIYNLGLDGRDLTLDTTSAFVFGSDWPRKAETPRDHTRPLPWLANVLTIAMTALIVFCVLGAWPWRMHVVQRVSNETGSDDDDDGHHVRGNSESVTQWWGTLWILGVWILLPMYGLFYCRSFKDPVGPWWPVTTLGWAPVMIIILAVLAFPLIAWWMLANHHWGRRVGAVTGLVVAALAGASFLCWKAPWWPAWFGWLGPAELGQLWALTAVAALPVAWCASAPNTAGRWGRLWRSVMVLGLLFVLCVLIWIVWAIVRHYSPPAMKWESIWFPRYLGFLWPAFAIAIVALLLRLPTRPLRMLAVGLLLGVNLLGGVSRIVFDSEPPYDVAAADIHQSQGKESTTRVIAYASKGASRGRWITNMAGRYYLAAYDHELPKPLEIRRGKFVRKFSFDRREPNARRWKALASPKSRYNKLIIWERMSRDSDKKIPRDNASLRLGKGWRQVDVRYWRWRQARGWRAGDWLARRVFVRVKPEKSADPQ